MICITAYNFMMTNDEASQKLCPYAFDIDGSSMETCAPNTCMAWIVANQRVEREDHSGARDVMQKIAATRNGQEIKREGPPGSLGRVYLESQGFCLRLWKDKS